MPLLFWLFCIPLLFVVWLLAALLQCRAWRAWGTPEWGESSYANRTLFGIVAMTGCLWASSAIATKLGVPHETWTLAGLITIPCGLLAGYLTYHRQS